VPGSTRPDEDDLIARFFRPLARDAGALSLVDDCAELTPPPGCDLVLKTDAVAAGVHFFAEDDWGAVARKALRVNLSDLAAKGATPIGYLLTLALPADWREADLARFAAGLAEDQATYGLSLYGGDTIRSPDGLIVSISIFGAVPHGRMVRRAAARPGDRLYVSGTLGDAALGLLARTAPARAAAWALDETEAAHLARRYLLPEPRARLAPAILAHARAAMDVSDGLGLDLTRMCRGSDTAAEVDVAALPLSAAASRAVAADPALLETVLGGGDDYEILAAVSPDSARRFEADAARAGVPVTAIGRVVERTSECRAGEASGPVLRFLDRDGRPLALAPGGFRHF
jgi:thiamine-monophosphate kinase